MARAADQTLQRPDGRRLSYAEYGSPVGTPLFYFHGHPGSRFEARFLAEAAAQTGVRLIGVDRPGLGLSSYAARRRLLDWPAEVAALADHLALERFAVVGFSGGGPYALACAQQLPRRLTACGLVAGVGALSPMLAFMAQWLPWLILPLTRGFFRDEANAERSLARFARNWPGPDQQALAAPGVRALMAASLAEALRPGTRGAAYDGVLLGRDWGFDLARLPFANVHLWHGELDREVPVATARAVAQRLPQCQATFYPAEAHISVIVNHAEAIVRALV
jgi:pimeloyl-ACP methyl ester carboxylesterase